MVARLKLETADFQSKADAAKAANKELAASFLDAAKTSEGAIASLKAAQRTGALGELGIDPRQVSGIIGQIKVVEKEQQRAAADATRLAEQTAREQTRLAERAADQQARLVAEQTRQAERAAAEQTRIAERAAAEQTRLAERVADQKARAAEKATKEAAQAEEKAARQRVEAQRLADKEILESQRNEIKEARGYLQLGRAEDSLARGNLFGAFTNYRRGTNALEQSGGGSGLLDAGLAAMTIGIVSSALKDATDKAVELKQAFDDGSKTSGEIADELIRSVPILGNIYGLGQNIRQLTGLENNDLENAIAFQEKLNDERSKLIDIENQIVEARKKAQEETQKITQHTDVIDLQAHGLDQQAHAQEIADKLKDDIKDFTEQQNKQTKDAQKPLLDILQKAPAQDQKALVDLLGASKQKQNDAQKALDDAKAAYAEVKDQKPMTVNNGEFSQTVDPAKDAKDQLTTAQDAFNKIQNHTSDLQKFVDKVKEVERLNVDNAQTIKDRTAALTAQAKAETDKAFHGVDPRDLDQQAKAKAMIESFHKAVEGHEPITDWLNKQLNGDAVKTLVGGTPLIDALTKKQPADISIRAKEDGSFEAMTKELNGSMVVSMLPKDTDLKAWIESQTHSMSVSVKPMNGDSIDIKNKPAEQGFNDWIKSLGGRVDVAVKPQFPNITNLLRDTLTGNPLVEWVERQADKAKPAFEKFAKNWQEEQKKLSEFRDQFHKQADPTANYREQLQAIQQLKDRGQINQGDLPRYAQDQFNNLRDDKRKTEDEINRPVYQLPNIKEVRSGEHLFAPPKHNDNKQLQKLDDINTNIGDLLQWAKNNGITINTIN